MSSSLLLALCSVRKPASASLLLPSSDLVVTLSRHFGFHISTYKKSMSVHHGSERHDWVGRVTRTILASSFGRARFHSLVTLRSSIIKFIVALHAAEFSHAPARSIQ